MTPAEPRRAALVFIFVVVLLDMLALGLVIPVLPRLVVEFLGGDTPRAAEIYGIFGTAWALMQFVFAPILGGLSDRFGRRPVILLSAFGHALDYVLMALAPSLAWLFVGRVISGITAASVSTAFAYIADVTAPERRARAFGMVGTAFGVGFVLGPALGGVLGSADPRLPFWAAAAMSLLAVGYGWFVLPESLGAERRARFALSRANPIGALGLLRAETRLLGLAATNFLAQLAHVALPSVSVLYMSHRYGWGELPIGLTLAGVGVCSMIVQGGLVGPVVARLGERVALALGLAAGALGFAVYGLAEQGALFVLGVPLMALWSLSGPAVQALMTRRVDGASQGRLQGANGSLQGIAGLIGPGLFTAVFAHFAAPDAVPALPGAPFFLAAVLLAAAGALGWRAAR